MNHRAMKVIADWFYLTPIALNKFQKNNPDETIHAYGATKGQLHDSEQPLAAYGWRSARRNTLILTDKRLICGDWEIQLNKVKYAEAVMFGSAIILKVADSSGSHYQFALQEAPMWFKQTVLPIKMSEEPVSPYKVRTIDKVVGFAIYAIIAIGMFVMLRDIFLWLF
ncbi:MAG: hypothetical protein Phog2KO_31950 [Phototrophicaceae bacterium]